MLLSRLSIITRTRPSSPHLFPLITRSMVRPPHSSPHRSFPTFSVNSLITAPTKLLLSPLRAPPSAPSMVASNPSPRPSSASLPSSEPSNSPKLTLRSQRRSSSVTSCRLASASPRHDRLRSALACRSLRMRLPSTKSARVVSRPLSSHPNRLLRATRV